MDTNPPAVASPPLLRWLHYALPISIAVYFVGCYILYLCLSLRRPRSKLQRDDGVQLRKVAFAAIFALLVTFAANSALCIAHALVNQGWWAQQDLVLFIMSSLLVWGCIAMVLLETERPGWIQYGGAFLLAAAGEVVICTQDASPSSQWDQAALCIQAFRITLLGGVSAYCMVSLFGSGDVLVPQDEENTKSSSGQAADRDLTQPLLGGAQEHSVTDGQPNKTNGSGPNYGAIPSEPDTDDSSSNESESDTNKDEKEIKEKLQKRLQEQGVFGYLKGFLIFLPYLWPRKERKIQAYFVLIGVCILSERALNVLEPRQEGILIDKLTQIHATGEMPWKEVGMWLLYLFLNSYSFRGQIQYFLEFHLDNWTTEQMVNLTFGHIMGLSMDFHDNKDSGELIKAVDQANALNELLRILFFEMAPIAMDLTISLWYVSHLFDIYFTFIIIAMSAVYFFITYRGTAWTARIRRGYAEESRNLGKIQYESISNWATVSYFNRASFEQNRLMTSLRDTLSTSRKLFKARALVDFSQSFCIYFARIAMSFLAAYRISQGQQTVGNFVTLNAYWIVFITPLWLLSYRSRDISNNLVDAERILQLMHTKPTITDKPGATPIEITDGRVEFKDVNFHYDKRKSTIKDVSFIASPGQTIALVGETGSGKSTIFRLLYRFYDVASGNITIDGQDVRDVTLTSLRDALGMVPQDATLFNVSILENVRYSRLDATDEEVHAACKAASIHDKILSFPDGYRTKVGERGVKLSGGELQRISIARILLKAPRIVLLDEATSAVDSSTEAAIQDAFSKLTKGRTTFVIAHRLSTIMDADLILVVDKGEIVERGTHDELLQREGKYKELWQTQTERHKKKVEESDKLLDI